MTQNPGYDQRRGAEPAYDDARGYGQGQQEPPIPQPAAQVRNRHAEEGLEQQQTEQGRQGRFRRTRGVGHSDSNARRERDGRQVHPHQVPLRPLPRRHDTHGDPLRGMQGDRLRCGVLAEVRGSC